MADYEVWVFCHREPTAHELDMGISGPYSEPVADGRMGDLKLARIDVTRIDSEEGDFSGWELTVSGGIVTGVYFEYD